MRQCGISIESNFILNKQHFVRKIKYTILQLRKKSFKVVKVLYLILYRKLGPIFAPFRARYVLLKI